MPQGTTRPPRSAWRSDGADVPRRPEWIFLPVLGMPVAHAPVLRFDLLPWLRRPISRRLFGANKTWRGALVMGGGTMAATVALYRVPEYRRRLPVELAD